MTAVWPEASHAVRMPASPNYNGRVRVLGIETSCDDTAIAVVEGRSRVLASIVSSQTSLHRAYGGVVPELASRHHLENIEPILDEALASAASGWTGSTASPSPRGPA